MLSLWGQYLPEFLKGLEMTIELTAASLGVALVLGFLLTLGRLSRVGPLSWIATAYIEIVRSVPVLIILFTVYYSLGQLGIKLNGPMSAIVGLGAFYATLYAEAFRGGIVGVDRGQQEAATALGMSHRDTLWHVVLPQAFLAILPNATNQLSNLIKDSSLVFTIGVADLMFQAQAAAATTFEPMDMLLLAGLIYFLLYLLLSKVLARWEFNVQRSRSEG